MLGPGKYDPECTQALEATKAKGVILLVFGGDRGSGASARLVPSILGPIPALLRKMADDIEADTKAIAERLGR